MNLMNSTTKKILLIIYLMITLCFFATAQATEPRNYAQTEQELRHYYDSGKYLADISAIMAKAERQLNLIIKQAGRQKPLAVVLDVDETSLSNIDLIFKAYRLVYEVGDKVPPRFFRDFNQPYRAPAIAPVLNFYNKARAHGIAIFFITGRYESGRSGTEINLHRVGFAQYKQLIMRPDQLSAKAVDFKTAARKTITEQGYRIIMNIGDQESDLRGGYAEFSYKLPNPYYLVP